MIEAFGRGLSAAGLEADHLQLAEILWLAERLPASSTPGPSLPDMVAHPPQPAESTNSPERASSDVQATRTQSSRVAPVGVYSAVQRATAVETATTSARRVFVPSAPAIPNVNLLARSLKPMRRRRPSRTERSFDEEATVTNYADFGVLSPVLQPEMERWFEVALVFDESPSMVIWRQTCAELYRALSRHGAFRDVRRWTLLADANAIRISSESGLTQSPRVLAGPSARRLILVVTDCIAPAWDGAAMWRTLADWAASTPVAIVHMLPERLWPGTALGVPTHAVSSVLPGLPNLLLDAVYLGWDAELEKHAAPLPVITLEEYPVRDWARVVMGIGGSRAPAVLGPAERPTGAQYTRRSGSDRVEVFRAAASPTAFDLATYLSAVDLTLPVMRLVQRAMLPESSPVHLAEFFLGGLIRRVTGADVEISPDEVRYEFQDGVRALLQRSLMKSEALRVLAHVASYLEERTGQPVDFEALVTDPSGTERLPEAARPFAEIGAQVLAQYAPRAPDRTSAVGLEQQIPEENDAQARAYDRAITTLSGAAVRRAAEQVPTPIDVPSLWRMARPFRVDQLGPAQRIAPVELTLYTLRVRLLQAQVTGRTIRLLVADPTNSDRVLMATFPDLSGVKADRVLSRKVREAREAAVEVLRTLGIDGPTGRLVPVAGIADIAGLAYVEVVDGPDNRGPVGITLNPVLQIEMVRGATTRWAVRTLADLDVGKVNFTSPVVTTVRDLRALPRPLPEHMNGPALHRLAPAELSVYRIVADLVGVNVQQSTDIRAIAADPSDPALTLTVRFPDPQFIWSGDSGLVGQMQSARTAILSAFGPQLPSSGQRITGPSRQAEITGVGFFDSLHGQAGMAPNGFTLHPVLQLRFLSEPEPQPVVTLSPERAQRISQLVSRDTLLLPVHIEPAYLLTSPSASNWAAWLAAPSQEELYDRIVQLVRAWSGAGSVQLILQQGDRLLVVRDAIDAPKRRYPEAAWNGVIGRAARERRTIWLPDVNSDSAYIRMEPTTRSELAVPLVRSDGSGLLGAINCEWDETVTLTTGDISWFEQLTLPISSALEAAATTTAPVSYQMLVTDVLTGSATFTDPVEQHGPFLASRMVHSVHVSYPVRMARYLVTNESYLEFVQSGGYSNPSWWLWDPGVPACTLERFVTQDQQSRGPSTWPSANGCLPGREKHPVAGVSYYEAEAFSRWFQANHPPDAGWQWTLPDEDAWELAARSSSGFRYPWGNEFEADRCNSREARIGSTSEVGAFPSGRSPSGCQDMSGNVWEFVVTDHRPGGQCVLRGGSYANDRSELSTYLHLTDVPKAHRPPDFGFRLAQISSPSASA